MVDKTVVVVRDLSLLSKACDDDGDELSTTALTLPPLLLSIGDDELSGMDTDKVGVIAIESVADGDCSNMEVTVSVTMFDVVLSELLIVGVALPAEKVVK